MQVGWFPLPTTQIAFCQQKQTYSYISVFLEKRKDFSEHWSWQHLLEKFNQHSSSNEADMAIYLDKGHGYSGKEPGMYVATPGQHCSNRRFQGTVQRAHYSCHCLWQGRLSTRQNGKSSQAGVCSVINNSRARPAKSKGKAPQLIIAVSWLTARSLNH
jgi:hypothetical protein